MNDQHMTFQSSGSTACFEAELALVNFHFFVFFLNVFCESAFHSETSGFPTRGTCTTSGT